MALSKKQVRILRALSKYVDWVTRKSLAAECGPKGFSEALGSPTTGIRANSLEALGFVVRRDMVKPYVYKITPKGRRALGAEGQQIPEYTHDVHKRGGTSQFQAKTSLISAEDEESRFPEGKAKYELHRRLERDTELARRRKQSRLEATGKLECEVCGFDFAAAYGDHGFGYIEAHHTVPISTLTGNTRTKASDLALVCSNCHRMLHRGEPLLSPGALKSILSRRANKGGRRNGKSASA